MNFLRSFVKNQVTLCKRIDRSFFPTMCIDGNRSFVEFINAEVPSGSMLVDVGAGKTPLFPAQEVKSRRLTITGVDIDAYELGAAPAGAYQRTVVGPIEVVRGSGENDIVLAQSVLEHVNDGRMAAVGISSFLKAGGAVYTFCPNRRAWFARLNLMLPEGIKRKLLFAIFPEKRERQGFPAHYSGCTPEEMRRNMANTGIVCEEIRFFYTSSYFMFFVPIYLLWRSLTFPLMKLFPERYCETFMFIGRKQ